MRSMNFSSRIKPTTNIPMPRYCPAQKVATMQIAVRLVTANPMGHCDGRPLWGMLKEINMVAQRNTHKMTKGQMP